MMSLFNKETPPAERFSFYCYISNDEKQARVGYEFCSIMVGVYRCKVTTGPDVSPERQALCVVCEQKYKETNLPSRDAPDVSESPPKTIFFVSRLHSRV